MKKSGSDPSDSPLDVKPTKAECGRAGNHAKRVYSIGCWFTLLIMMGFVLATLMMAGVPPVSRDALTHHLAIPKLWIEKGEMVAFPDLPYSYYPMNLDLLYVVPMLFGNDVLPKTIHFLFALMTAGLIYQFLKTKVDRLLAILSALLFLSTPIILKLSISAYVDLGFVFFTWASIYFLFRWARGSENISYLLLSAVFCGLGLGTKYNGLIVLLILVCFVPILFIRSGNKNSGKKRWIIGYAVIFSLVALLFFSPWMIRNARLTGNPVYPIFKNLIGTSPDLDQPAVSNLSMKPWVQRKLIYKESVWETVFIPVRIFFQGQDDNPKFFDGRLNPFLLIFPILFFIIGRNPDKRLRLEQVLLGLFSILYLLIAGFMVDMRIRYIAPIIPPLSVLAAFGIRDLSRWINSWCNLTMKVIGRWSLVGVVCCMVAINANYLYELFRSVDPLPYLLGKTTREAYLSHKLADYEAIEFVNHIEPEPVKIFALFMGRRLYYFDKNVEFGNTTFIKMVKDAAVNQGLALQLQRSGFTHCIIGLQSFEGWLHQTFNDEQKSVVYDWLRYHCRLLFHKHGYAVFELIL